jgi:hypothetical protein
MKLASSNRKKGSNTKKSPRFHGDFFALFKSTNVNEHLGTGDDVMDV